MGDWAILTSAVDPRFNDDLSRPALAQTFVRLGSGERVTVVVNHLKSKSQSGLTDASDPNFDQGDGQGFWNHTRTLAAQALADWVAGNPTGENAVGTLIIGDLNSYGREDPIRALEDEGFEDQLVRYTEGAPYTFTFDGMQGTLDTALATETMAARVTGAAVWHINADEVPAIDYQESVGVSFNRRFRTPEIAEAYYDPSAFRSSDHDPVVIGIAWAGAARRRAAKRCRSGAQSPGRCGRGASCLSPAAGRARRGERPTGSCSSPGARSSGSCGVSIGVSSGCRSAWRGDLVVGWWLDRHGAAVCSRRAAIRTSPCVGT